MASTITAKRSCAAHRTRVSIAVGRARDATPTNHDIGFEDKFCASRREKRCSKTEHATTTLE
jgi:hypothetical protein